MKPEKKKAEKPFIQSPHPMLEKQDYIARLWETANKLKKLSLTCSSNSQYWSAMECLCCAKEIEDSLKSLFPKEP